MSLQDRIEQARAALVTTTEAIGFASDVPDPVPQSHPRPAPAPAVPLCQVGFCHPRTVESVAVKKVFCARHRGVLSGPMLDTLDRARRGKKETAEGWAKRWEALVEQAVIEARRLDTHWHPFVILEREHVEPFESFEKMVRRYFALAEQDLAPAAMGIRSQHLLSVHELRAWSPHTIVDHEETPMAAGKNLNEAATAARKRYLDRELCKPVWPGGVAPTAVNVWTGERLEWDRVWDTVAKGWRD